MGIPMAIVIAGALIAGAVYFSNAGGPAAPGTSNGSEVVKKVRTVQNDDHIRGDKDAKVVIVEYSDTECPFCKSFHQTLQQIVSEYSPNEVAWVYRHFPLAQLHPKAPKEAEALECAAEQGGNDIFWEYTDMVYAATKSNNSLDIGVYNTPSPVPTGADGKPYYAEKTPRSTTDAGQLSDIASELGLDVAQFEECLATSKYASKVETDLNEAFDAGGNGTPHSIMIVGKNQTAIQGAQQYNTVKNLIDAAL